MKWQGVMARMHDLFLHKVTFPWFQMWTLNYELCTYTLISHTALPVLHCCFKIKQERASSEPKHCPSHFLRWWQQQELQEIWRQYVKSVQISWSWAGAAGRGRWWWERSRRRASLPHYVLSLIVHQLGLLIPWESLCWSRLVVTTMHNGTWSLLCRHICHMGRSMKMCPSVILGVHKSI